MDRSGVLIPCEEKPSSVYKQLFLQGTADEIEQQVQKLELGQSIMDSIADQTKSLARKLGPHDQARVDQYLTGVRELEKRLAAAKEWESVPKPKAPIELPLDPANPRSTWIRCD